MSEKSQQKLFDELKNLAKKAPENKLESNDFRTTDIEPQLIESDVSRVIEMAWEDRTPFEAIEQQFDLSEPQVIHLMRTHTHHKNFKLWRKRVSGRVTKHRELRPDGINRAYCPTQYKHK